MWKIIVIILEIKSEIKWMYDELHGYKIIKIVDAEISDSRSEMWKKEKWKERVN